MGAAARFFPFPRLRGAALGLAGLAVALEAAAARLEMATFDRICVPRAHAIGLAQDPASYPYSPAFLAVALLALALPPLLMRSRPALLACGAALALLTGLVVAVRFAGAPGEEFVAAFVSLLGFTPSPTPGPCVVGGSQVYAMNGMDAPNLAGAMAAAFNILVLALDLLAFLARLAWSALRL